MDGIKNQRKKNVQAILSALSNSDIMSTDDVLDMIEMKEKERILSQHPFEIWQASDGRYKSYLPDETKKNNRRMIAKKSREDLEKLIVDDYKRRNQKQPSEKMTLRKLYPEWFDFKALHASASTYMHRIDNDWKRFYEQDEIIDIPLETLDKLTLEAWALQKIRDGKLSKKQYYNATIIIRQAFFYALEKGYICDNPFERVRINPKLFKKIPKKNDDTQVYLEEEQKQLVQEALKDYHEKPESTASLAIALYFQIGLRVGELVALRECDIKGNYISIERMEVRKEERRADGKWVKTGYEVVDHTKTDAGQRSLYLTTEAKKYLKMILDANKENGYGEEDYLLVDKNGRIHERAIDTRIRKYCSKIGIMAKSSHKIRKTYISTLIDSGLNINKVRAFAGHESEMTTYNSYCYSRLSDKQTEDLLEKTLCS